MKKEDIHLDDIARILFGNAPPEFLLEVVIRTIIMYLALVAIVRLLGKRTNALLTITERSIFIRLYRSRCKVRQTESSTASSRLPACWRFSGWSR